MGSNHARNTDYLHWNFRAYPQILQANNKTVLSIRPLPLFIRGLNVRRHTFPVPTGPNQLCGPFSTLFITGVLSYGIKRPRRETEHLPPYIAEDEEGWSYSSTPPYSVTVFNLTFYGFLTQPFQSITQLSHNNATAHGLNLQVTQNLQVTRKIHDSSVFLQN
jgi:hypothetical protein